MVVLVTAKNEDRIKNEGDRVLKTLNINFSDTQEKLTLQSVITNVICPC